MAENYYFIFVANQLSPDIAQLLPKLGLVQYEPEAEVGLWETNKPETLFVGHYNNSLILLILICRFTSLVKPLQKRKKIY